MIKLSLCIPTYNRLKYLGELVPMLLPQIAVANHAEVHVELLISDNASTDGTDAYLKALSCPGLCLYRNNTNIGGDHNIFACIARASGEYVWLVGDDEIVEPDGVARVLVLLSENRFSLMVLRDGRESALAEAETKVYPEYGECVRSEMVHSKSFALSHTLISANVFRRDVFDLEYAADRLHTNYAHMYGLLKRLRSGGAVAVASGVFRTRPQRAQFARWPFALCLKQALYLWRLAGWFEVPLLRWRAFRLACNLPVEMLACVLHKVCPRFGRT